MKKYLLIQLAICFAISIFAYFFSLPQQAISFFAGSFIVLTNLFALTWVWSRILQKKLIALSASIIVFKYAIFAVIIYKILKMPTTDMLWFCLGLSSLLMTALIGGILCRST